MPPVTKPRPGHADLAGMIKYGTGDLRNILERSSARETTARVAVGAVARKFLAELGIRIRSRTARIGPIIDEPGLDHAPPRSLALGRRRSLPRPRRHPRTCRRHDGRDRRRPD